jgi:hypothetical protein
VIATIDPQIPCLESVECEPPAGPDLMPQLALWLAEVSADAALAAPRDQADPDQHIVPE